MPNKERIHVPLKKGEIATIVGLGLTTIACICALTRLNLSQNNDLCLSFLAIAGVLWGSLLVHVGLNINSRINSRRHQIKFDIEHNIIDGKWHNLPKQPK